MNTENLDAEYSVLFLLFSKEKYNVYRRLVDVGLTSEYFSVILHRKIAKYLMDFLHRNEKYSIKSFGTYFASVEPEESVVYERFVDVAKKHKIPWQKEINPNTIGNDTRAMQVSRSGIASASISVPNRYMHTQVEVCSLKDLDNIAKLIAEFIKTLTPRTDFIIR